MKIFGNNTDMKLLAAVVLGVLFFGCAYDPMMDEGDSKSEFHADDLERGIDLVVNSSLVLNGAPEKIARLIFLQDAVLSTDGADLKLVVDEIISHGGKISTLPISTKPELSADGLSGGSLHVEARTGRGHLTILAEGQSGGEGAKGSSGARGPKGPRGNNGETGREVECMSLGLLSFFPDRPGPCFPRYYCKRQTGDGGRGGQGHRGGKGSRGGNGGDSAAVFVQIKDPSDLSIATESHVGLGGAGGQGGDGGRGGEGGDAGSQDRAKECRKASSGPEGPRGPTGERGSKGTDGKRNPICLVLGSARIGDCDAFGSRK
jgi:hypothetical protein